MSRFVNIKVHEARAEQLRKIAAARGLNIAGMIDHFVGREIKEGVIGPDLPGFIVTGVPGSTADAFVMLDIEGYELPDMEPTIAGFFANTIATVAEQRGRDGVVRIALDDGNTLNVGRKGGAVFLVIQDGHGQRIHQSTLSYSMATDLAAQIHRARSKAQGAEGEVAA